MKTYPILKLSSIAVALALSAAVTPSMAEDYPVTVDTPSQLAPPDSQLQTSPGEQPATGSYNDPSLTIQQPRGAQGPIRSDEATEPYQGSQYQGYDRDRYETSSRYSGSRASDRGYLGFLQFQERGTNSP